MVKWNKELEARLDGMGVESRDLNDQKYFSSVVKLALDEYGVDPIRFAREIGCAAVYSPRLWADGRVMPDRKKVEYVIEQVAERINK